MIRLIFLLPVLMCLGWYLFLKHYDIPLQQGKKGFIYIAIFNLVIGVLLWGLLILTNP